MKTTSKTISGWRKRVAFASLAAIGFVVSVQLPARAAGGAPLTPTDLLNGNLLPCATDASAPLVYNPVGDFRIEGRPGDTDPSESVLTEQYQLWPVSDPSQISSWSLSGVAGLEAPLNVPGSLFADGETYAWHAATVADGTTSAWSAPCYVTADETPPANAPTISSSNYQQGVFNQGGLPVHVTFGANGVSDVMGYAFTWVGNPPINTPLPDPLPDPFTGVAGTVLASADGSVTLDLIPPPTSFARLTVVSFDRAFNSSPQSNYDIDIKSSVPNIALHGSLPNFGKPTKFDLSPDSAIEAQSPVVSYEVEVAGGGSGQQEFSVPATADGTAQVNVTIDSPTGEWLFVSSKSADGWVTPQNQYLINPSPTVTSNVYTENGTSGGVGVTGTFTFAPPFHGVASYTYTVGFGGTPITVKAHDGWAKIHWTPTASGQQVIEVYATLADGTQLFPYDYFFNVA